MATSSIRRNFVVEGQDAVDFADSLEAAFKERDERRKNYTSPVKVVSEEEKKRYFKEAFRKCTREIILCA